MWRTVTLDEVCTLRNGRAYKKPELLSEGKYPVLRVGNFFTSGNWYYSDLELEETKYCANGDLLYAWSASFGPRIWEGGKVIYHYHIWRVDVDEKLVDRKFLFYWFEYDKELVKAASGTGTTMMHVSKGSMEKRVLQLPPLAEQQRIVAKLDAAFAEIDKAETVLVEKETGITNVFEAQVRRYFTENVLSAEYKKLSEVAEYFNGLTYSPKDVCDEGVIVLRSSNIQDGKIELSNLVRVKKKIREKLIVKPNDILICSRNGSRRLIGKSALIDDSADGMTFGTFMMIVRSELNEYLQWFFKSSLFKQQIAQGEHTAINQITRYMLDEVVLPIPSLVECKNVNEEINALDAKVRDVLVILAKQRNELLKLKSAILAQELQPLQSEAA